MTLFRNRDFVLLALGFVLVQGTLPFQLVAPIFWVQEHSSDDSEVLLVGILSTVRGVAMVGFAAYGGTLADRFDRRRLLLAVQVGSVAVSLAIVALVATAGGGGWAMTGLFALVFVASGLWAVDLPTRQAMVPDVVGQEDASRALALIATGTWILTPMTIIAVGFIIDAIGFTGAFGLVTALLAFGLLCLLPMRYRPVESDARAVSGGGWNDFRAGVAYTWSQPVLRWLVGLTVLMTGLAMPAISGLGPTWVTTVVGASFTEFGFIAAFWGIGALVASITLARYSRPHRTGRIVALGAMLFGVGFLVFGIGHTPANAIMGNLLVGSGLVATQVAGVALIAQIAPNDIRGRVTSLLLVDRALAQLLALPAAAIAHVIGITRLFPILGVLCLAVVILFVATRSALWLRPLDEPQSRVAR